MKPTLTLEEFDIAVTQLSGEVTAARDYIAGAEVSINLLKQAVENGTATGRSAAVPKTPDFQMLRALNEGFNASAQKLIDATAQATHNPQNVGTTLSGVQRLNETLYAAVVQANDVAMRELTSMVQDEDQSFAFTEQAPLDETHENLGFSDPDTLREIKSLREDPDALETQAFDTLS